MSGSNWFSARDSVATRSTVPRGANLFHSACRLSGSDWYKRSSSGSWPTLAVSANAGDPLRKPSQRHDNSSDVGPLCAVTCSKRNCRLSQNTSASRSVSGRGKRGSSTRPSARCPCNTKSTGSAAPRRWPKRNSKWARARRVARNDTYFAASAGNALNMRCDISRPSIVPQADHSAPVGSVSPWILTRLK